MTNVPNLRFNNFNDKWQEHVLGDIFEFYTTNSFSRDFLDNDNGSVKNIHYGDIHMKFPTILDVKNNGIPYVKETVDLSKISIEAYCKNGDVVIADASEDYNDIGKAIELKNVGEEKLLAGLHTILARDSKQVMVNGFRGYLMSSPNVRKQIKVYAAGAKVLGISKANISKVNLLIPSSIEQEKIASLFSLIDKKIELQTEKVEELKNYKKGIMQKIFSQELRFKDEDGNEYPEWEERKLGNLINEYEYKTDSNNKYPILSSTLNGIVLQSNYFSKQTASVDTTGYKIVPRGYFTYRSMSDTGVFRFNMQEVVDFGIVSPAYPVFASSDKINSKFLELVLNHSPGVKRQLLITKEGGTRYALGFKKLKQIQVMIPCKLEQEKIAILIRNLDSKVNKEEQKLVALIDYKKGLLQQMFI